jgi:hypothetical protein
MQQIELIKQLKQVICKVNCDGVVGTSFLVKPDLAITALHVIYDYDKKRIKNEIILSFSNILEKNLEIRARKFIFNEKMDFALLILDNTIEDELKKFEGKSNYPIEYLKISPNLLLKEGQEWNTFAYSKSFLNKGDIYHGIISKVGENDENIREDFILKLDSTFLNIFVSEELDDFSALSGAPLIVDNLVVGLIIRQMNQDLLVISFDRIFKEIPVLNDIEELNYPEIINQNAQEKSETFNPEPNDNFVADYENDSITEKNLVDKLDITKDVHAFATLISSKTLVPPLAIGLFGKWGSGKSFFMKMLENQIEEFSSGKGKNSFFSEKIIHVYFNSWHYTEENLWASLVATIFSKLDESASTNKELQKILYEKLKTSKKLINEADMNLKQINEEIKSLHNFRDNYKNILKGLISKESFEELKKDENLKKLLFDPLNSQIKVLKENPDFNEINELINSLHKPFQQLLQSIKVFYKGNKVLFLLIVSFTIFLYYITPYISSFLTNLGIKERINIILTYFSPILPIIITYLTKLKYIINKINTSLEKAKSYIDSELKENINKEKKAEEELKNAENELKEIKSGKRLLKFIEDRHKSTDYKKHLGLISLIREDFKELKNQLDKNKENPIIDKIILYIDDLDRCSEKRVIQVLEAIHLILGSELFVVVVSVDSRWVSKALIAEYSALLKDSDNEQRNAATSFDYLEKVFQIPFVIKPMEGKYTYDLIKYLFKDEILSPKPEKEVSGESSFSQRNTDYDGNVSDKNINQAVKTQENKALPEMKDSEEQKTSTSEPVKHNSEQFMKKLNISQKELDFMEVISPILGTTPRGLKRFVNIYKIIRAHQNMPLYKESLLDEFKCVMFLLALTINYSEITNYLIKKIGEKDKVFLKEIFNDDFFNNSSHLNKNYLGKINTLIKEKPEICEIKVEIIRKHINFISRFSFRIFE